MHCKPRCLLPPLVSQGRFRAAMEAYFGEASRVSFRLLEAFCCALAIPLDSLHHLFDVRGAGWCQVRRAGTGRQHARQAPMGCNRRLNRCHGPAPLAHHPPAGQPHLLHASELLPRHTAQPGADGAEPPHGWGLCGAAAAPQLHCHCIDKAAAALASSPMYAAAHLLPPTPLPRRPQTPDSSRC